METPQEKAKRLGVPLSPKPPFNPQPKQNPLQLQQQDYAERMKVQLMGLTASVCETCNKELTRQQQRPCGNILCPFGTLTY